MNSLNLICEFLKDRLNVDPGRVTPDASLAELGVDSLMLLELMFEFEDRFEIKIDNDVAAPKTVGDMIALMDGLIANQKS